MLLFRCKIRKVMHCVCFLYLFCCFFIASVLILYKKDKIKNGYIVIFNIIINIKKGIGGNDAVLLVILLWNLQRTST